MCIHRLSSIFRRNSVILSREINHACEVLQSMCEDFTNNGKQTSNVDLADQKEPWVLSLSEKDELLNGLKDLYNASDRIEQVRLLTIAPGHWGRQKVQSFFDSSQRQARQSREIRLTKGVLASPEEMRGNQPLDPAIIRAVVQFYEQDWISRVSPNKADVILIRKQSTAKRFMLLTIGEGFEKFKNDYPQYPIGRSKFFNLRPRHVYPMTLHDTCCCIYHENFDLVLKVKNESCFIPIIDTFYFTFYNVGMESEMGSFDSGAYPALRSRIHSKIEPELNGEFYI